MKHESIEELLAAYAAGDVTAEERERVERALSESAELRAELAGYRALEEALVARRAEVPPVDRFLGWLQPAAAESPMVARLHRWLDALVSVPGMAVITAVTLALWSYWNADRIANTLNQFAGGSVEMNRFDTGVATLLQSVQGIDAWTLVGVSGVLAILAVATTSLMAARFIRS